MMFWLRKACVRGGILAGVLSAAAVLLLLPQGAAAQTVVDARFAEFTASADHDVLLEDGSPKLTSYSLEILLSGTNTLSTTVNLGKPAALADGTVRVDFVSLLSSPLPSSVEYQARVVAIGPGGTASSELSNPFAFAAPCAPTLSSSGGAYGATAGAASVSVSAAAGCAWSASTNTAWLTITSGATGSGNGSVMFTIAANTGAARTGTLSIAAQTYTVSQAAASCGYTISPASRNAGAAAESVSVAVTTASGCTWTAAAGATWLSVPSGASGSGNGTVTINIAANTGGARAGTVSIAGRAFTVNQAATACTYSISPTTRTSAASGETANVSITAGSGCAWSAASQAAWLTFNGSQSGTGNGLVSVVVGANTASVQRTGTVTIAGRTFTVTQNASACNYTVTPVNLNLSSAAGSGSFTVTTSAGCTWMVSAAPAWITLSGVTRTGSGTAPYSVIANPGSQRSATVMIAGKSISVKQNAGGPPPPPGNLRIGGNVP